MPELKLYTIAQLRDWVLHNSEVEGLSEMIISRTRAYALVNNPYVSDEDPVVAAIFVDGENAAYVTAFPELIDEKRYWWFSALWCNPKYQGNGYGLIVIGSLAEIYGYTCCLDRWGAKETVEIFTYLGLKTTYTPRYLLGVKIDRTTTKGKFVHFIRSMQRNLHRILEHPIRNETYTLRYLPIIDDDTYTFIVSNQETAYILHTQEYMNWVLTHPFNISAPLIERVANQMPFADSEKPSIQLFAVQVLDGSQIIGFYLMKSNADALHILYLYYDDSVKYQVFASIRDHIRRMHIAQCVTENKHLADYLQEQLYFPKCVIQNISFSYSESMHQPLAGHVQYGDGDCFTA